MIFLETGTFFYFLTASILLTIAPGPDILYLLTKSLASGAKCGIMLAAGLSSGIVFHTFLVMAGVAAIIQSSLLAMTALKFFGAAYLLFLATKSFQAAKRGGQISMAKSDDEISAISIYRRGVLMNVLNPKVLLFFLAFLPQFVNLSEENASLQIIFLGVTFAAQAFIIFSLVAVGAGKVRKILLRQKNLGRILNFVEAAVLAIIAATLLIF